MSFRSHPSEENTLDPFEMNEMRAWRVDHRSAIAVKMNLDVRTATFAVRHAPYFNEHARFRRVRHPWRESVQPQPRLML